MSSLRVAFDVDGTLLSRKPGYEETPNYDVIKTYIFYRDVGGAQMIIWSGCGEDWARTWAQKLGLKNRFEDVATDPWKIMEKPRLDDPNRIIPDITFDDEVVLLGHINVQV